MKILVTGSAGFIGFHTVKFLLQRGDCVVGFDNINDYYDVAIKQARLKTLDDLSKLNSSDYQFINGDIGDKARVTKCFKDGKFDRVINLAAQAGVRYSLENPQAYVDSNVVGFTNILEACILFKAKIIDGTTPPAPNINTFLSVKLNFDFSTLILKPSISVLCPINLSFFK